MTVLLEFVKMSSPDLSEPEQESLVQHLHNGGTYNDLNNSNGNGSKPVTSGA